MQPNAFGRDLDHNMSHARELLEDLWEMPGENLRCVWRLAAQPELLARGVPRVPLGECRSWLTRTAFFSSAYTAIESSLAAANPAPAAVQQL
jgi:hypothetical protein